MKKKILCVFLSVLLTVLCCAGALAEAAPATFRSAAETNAFVVMGYDFTTPMRLTPATLTKNGEETDVWFVSLLGVKSVKGQVNVAKNTFAAAFNRTNPYFDFVKKTLLAAVPAGAKLVIAGHSLGGMVAQKLRTDAALREAFEIVNVVTCGSPYIMVKENEAEGELHRLADVNDAVPFLSPATLICLSKQLGTAHREDGGYLFNPDAAHNLSYMREDVWGGYDALGVPGGDAVLSFDAAAVQAFGDAA